MVPFVCSSTRRMKSGMVMRIFSRSFWGRRPQSETGCTFMHLMTSKFVDGEVYDVAQLAVVYAFDQRDDEDDAVEACFTQVLDGFHLGFEQVDAADELVNFRG